ncbi:DUF433 domain-containing protein [Acrocarpospora macrocephala]|nr:DUF433 domain-containing protein [Acrocarpospora macrocephala]
MTVTAEATLDPHHTLPIYTKTQAAKILSIPASTFRNWAVGYAYKTLTGSEMVSAPVVTTVERQRANGPSVPFVGLAEAYIVAAFTHAGVPMQRIRPAVTWLQEHVGLEQALASERLKTDGAEVLWDFGLHSGDPADRDMIGNLVVIRSGQGVFQGVVQDYLRRVSYQDGWIRTIQLPSYHDINVIVDPWLNGGQPTVASRGIPISDILDRRKAGESREDLAYDYELSLADILALEEAN